MNAVAFPLMARPKSEERKPVNPSEPVRYVGKMTRAERALLKYFCERIGRDMEIVGVEWIMERLRTEMGKKGWRIEDK